MPKRFRDFEIGRVCIVPLPAVTVGSIAVGGYTDVEMVSIVALIWLGATYVGMYVVSKNL